MGKDKKAQSTCRGTEECITYRGKQSIFKSECLENFGNRPQGKVRESRYREVQEEFAEQVHAHKQQPE
jgi:hypothetical protein